MQLLWFTLGLGASILLLCGFWVSRLFIERFAQTSIYLPKYRAGFKRKEKIRRSLFPQPSISRPLAQFSGDLTQQFAPEFSREFTRGFSGGAWQQILDSAPIGYLQVDEQNRLYWCNQKSCDLLNLANWQREKSDRRLLLQLVRSYELDQLIEQTRQQGRSLQQEWIFRRVNPDPIFPIQADDLPLRGRSLILENQHIGIFLEDYSQEFLLVQQRDRWAADVAHELKTPLTSIRLLAETVYQKLPATEKSWIERLLKEVLRLAKLVDDLLDLSKLDIGMPMRLNPTTFDLVDLIHATWASLEPIASLKKINLMYEGLPQAPMQADESRIYRLLLNLLDNAVKHSPSLQIILVKLTQLEDAQVQIEVVDSGAGFPAESLPHIFERFYRVDASRSRANNDQGGSGLGLAIVSQIVQAHGGEIHVCNHPETNGAWIRVVLPTGNSGDFGKLMVL